MRDKTLLARARHMRANPTPAEAALWYHLRAHRFEHQKFRHQTVLDRYIIDFTSRTAMLAIEVDGDTHATQPTYDAARTRWLEARGFHVLRFANRDVTTNIDGVLQVISQTLAARSKPPSLRLRGEGPRHSHAANGGKANSHADLPHPLPT